MPPYTPVRRTCPPRVGRTGSAQAQWTWLQGAQVQQQQQQQQQKCNALIQGLNGSLWLCRLSASGHIYTYAREGGCARVSERTRKGSSIGAVPAAGGGNERTHVAQRLAPARQRVRVAVAHGGEDGHVVGLQNSGWPLEMMQLQIGVVAWLRGGHGAPQKSLLRQHRLLVLFAALCCCIAIAAAAAASGGVGVPGRRFKVRRDVLQLARAVDLNTNNTNNNAGTH